MRDEYDVVIVEDNSSDAELIVRSLRQNQQAKRLIVLEDGEQALDFIFCRGQYADVKSAELPTVIFLDLKLPKVDGLEVLRQLKSTEQTRKIPVIIISSSREETDISAAYTLGANSYVVKPVNFDRFNEVMNLLGTYWLGISEKQQ